MVLPRRSIRGMETLSDRVDVRSGCLTRRAISVGSAVLVVVGVVGAFAIPSGPLITIDNRGLLGPFDPAAPAPNSGRGWLRFLVIAIAIVMAILLRALDPSRRRRSLAWASGVIVAAALILALLYPTGPPDPPPGRCWPGGRLGPNAPECGVYYSDHQPGPTYMPFRIGVILFGLGGGLALLAARRKIRVGEAVEPQAVEPVTE
jgi:hypothetical protein